VSDHRLSLRKRTLKAGAWTTGGIAASQVIRLGSNLILTRLLFPEAFGLMSIVYVLMVGLALFSDLGVNASIIQNRHGDKTGFLNTAWSVKILRGVLIFIVIMLIAYNLPLAIKMNLIPVGSVYADPLLPFILAAFSVTPILQGFESTNIALAQRNVQLRKVTIMELVSQIISMLVTIIWALLYHNVWALVAGSIMAAVIRCVMSHYYLKGPTNKLQWEPLYFSEIFHFGKWVFLLSIIGFLAINGDRIMLAGFLDSAVLGVYSIATLLILSVQMLLNKMLSMVVFPAFSEVAETSPEKVPHVYCRFQLLMDLFLFGASGFLFVAADSIINLLYDARYSTAGSMLAVLALGLIGARHGAVEQLWLATANMRPLFISRTFRLILLFSGIPLGYSLAGLHGALVAIVISNFAGWPVAFYYRFKHALIDWKYEFIGVLLFAVLVLIGDWLLSIA